MWWYHRVHFQKSQKLLSSLANCKLHTNGYTGTPKRMQRFWSVISTMLLIEYRWYLLYWIEYSFPSNLTPSSSSMDRAFWFLGLFFWGSVIFKMCYFSPRKQAWSSWNLVPQSCVMNASLSFILSSFSKWGQLCFCQQSWFWNKFQLLAGEKWHILKMTLPQNNSPRIKTPYPYFMNLVSNYLEKNILSNTAKINGIQSRMSLK